MHHPVAFRLAAIRRVRLHKESQQTVALSLNVSKSTLWRWLHNKQLLALEEQGREVIDNNENIEAAHTPRSVYDFTDSDDEFTSPIQRRCKTPIYAPIPYVERRARSKSVPPRSREPDRSLSPIQIRKSSRTLKPRNPPAPKITRKQRVVKKRVAPICRKSAFWKVIRPPTPPRPSVDRVVEINNEVTNLPSDECNVIEISDVEQVENSAPQAPKDTVGSGELAWPAQNNLPSPGPSRKPDSVPRPSTSRKSDHVPRPSTSTSSMGGFNIKPDPGTPPPMMMNPYLEQQQQQHMPQPAPRLMSKPLPPQQSQQQQMRLRVRPPPMPPPPPEPEPEQEPQQVCLRWNSFHSNMQTMFPSLLNREKFVDVTLACEGRSIKCHKVVLSSCSSYLERLLSENPCKHPIIMMPRDLRFWECRALVDFMYRGEVNVEHEQLPSLLAAAEALQIKGLAGPASSLPDQGDEPEERPPSPRHKRKRTSSPPPPHMAPAAPPAPPQRPHPPPRERLPVSPPRIQLSPPLLPNSPAVSITRLVPRSQAASSNCLPQRQTASSPASHLDLQAHSPGIEITPVVSFEEIKMEPIDISDSNDESMDQLDQGHDFDMDKDYEGEDAALASGGDEEDAGGGSGSASHLDSGSHHGSHLDSHLDSHSGNNGIMDSTDNQEQLGSDMSTPGFSGNGLDFTNDLDDQEVDLEEEGFADLAMPNEAGEPPDEDEPSATIPGDA